MDDLWPSDIGKVDIVAPVSILKAQASLLGQKTSNLVVGLIDQIEKEHWATGEFNYAFLLFAPTLNYRYELFITSHPIDLYPLEIRAESDIMTELGVEVRWDAKIIVNSEVEFTQHLKSIFSAKKTRRVISSLLAQVGLAPSEESDDLPF